MIDFLLGVPGKLKSISDWLTTYWTAARAAKVDNLDAAISTRSAAATALTNATWTDARAGKLDGTIQTSVIQSIQTNRCRGITTVQGGTLPSYTDVAISEVVVAKCVVTTQSLIGQVSARLTSSTNLRVECQGGSASSEAIWTVVEYK